MIPATIEHIGYVTGNPNADGDDGSAFVRTKAFVTTINFKQANLVGPDGGNWGDEEVRAEVERKINIDPRYEGMSFSVVFPPKPIFPATPEEPERAPLLKPVPAERMIITPADVAVVDVTPTDPSSPPATP